MPKGPPTRKELENRLAEPETALAELREKHRIISEFSQDWEDWRDEGGAFQYVSPSCERITGYRPEEFVRDPSLFLRIIHPADHRLVAEHVAAASKEAECPQVEFRILRQDGGVRWIGHVCRQVFDGEGRLRGRHGSNRDITDRKLAEETREKARHDLERRIGEGTAALSNTVIRERLGLLGGRLEVEIAPGRGSRLTLVAPLQPLAASRAATGEPLPTVAAAGGHDAAGALFSTGRRTRVLLADDHAVMRQGLAALLQEEPDIEIVGQASDGRMAVELASQLRPDVIVMDVTMPRMGGVEATRLVHDEIPAIRIIGLSLHDEADMGNAMRQAGAVTYLNKGGPAEPLIAAIRGCVPVN